MIVKKVKVKKNIVVGVVYISSSFNNIIVNIADTRGNTLSWATAGSSGFKGAKKSTPYAGQLTASIAIKKAIEYGIKTVSVIMVGPGNAREAALRAIYSAGISIMSLEDRTAIAHNGCRQRKKRRV
ncbi:MAG: 30S ribosomal protein S11 [Rickettsiaceae bacterium H1]|nr:30S ribosomal protein S11 [Rickettsiaceae bacterium H1]